MNPKGGTELQFDELKKRLPDHYWKKINLTTSVPEKTPIEKGKLNILWLKNSHDQPNIQPWFSKPENHNKYDWYVFNSNWTYEKFRYFFDIPDKRSAIIKNGIDYEELQLKTDFIYKPPLKLIYFSTPWRGLDVLLKAMKALENEKDIELDVYSSTLLYG